VAARGGRDGVLACLLTPVVRWVAIRYGVLARPSGRSAAHSMPMVGGRRGGSRGATSSASYPEEVPRRQDAKTSPPVTG
jgi:hypothetical protein